MADTNKITYVSFDKLSYYDGKIKSFIADADTVVKNALEGQINLVAGSVDTLSGKVGNIPADSGATSVIDYINKKTTGIASSETVNGIDARLTQAEKDIDAIEKDYLKASDKTELNGLITANTNAIATLNGTGAGSVKKTVDDAINKFATDVTSDDVVNSYKELIDWVAKHGSDAGEMAKAIEANATAIDNLDKFVGDLPDGATSTTVVGHITTLVNAEKERAEGIEGGLETRLQAVEGKFNSGEGTVSSMIATAKQEAINHANGLDSAMNTRVLALEAIDHTHSNKDLLDSYTQTEANLADAVSKKHSHDNKSVLDGITSTKVSAWDSAEENAKSHADGLNTSMNTRVEALEAFVDGIEFCTETDIDNLFKTNA